MTNTGEKIRTAMVVALGRCSSLHGETTHLCLDCAAEAAYALLVEHDPHGQPVEKCVIWEDDIPLTQERFDVFRRALADFAAATTKALGGDGPDGALRERMAEPQKDG